MTEVKKFAWSGVIVVLAAVAAMAMLLSPASALDDLNGPFPDTINVGDTATIEAEEIGGFQHAEFEITSSGGGGGQAVFTANGGTTLICSNNNDDNPPGFPDCDLDDDNNEIEVEVQGIQPGQVQICASGYEFDDTQTSGSPRCEILTILGSQGGVLTLEATSTSIGRPGDISGWDFSGSTGGDEDVMGSQTLITATLEDNAGNPIPDADIDFATTVQFGTLEGGEEPFNLQLDDDDGNTGEWTHGPQDCETEDDGTCSVFARTISTTPFGSHLVTAVSDFPIFAGNTIQIIVAEPPTTVEWDLDDPQGASTTQEVGIHVTDDGERPAWTGLEVFWDEGDGSLGNFLCAGGVNIGHGGTAACDFLSPGNSPTAILAVNVGGGGPEPDTYQLQIVGGDTPESGEFNPTPVAGGLTIVTYTGSLSALISDGAELDLVSCFATIDGDFVGHIFGVGAETSFVNSAFAEAFEDGLDEQGLICRRA